jgi:hypothetical protein
MLNLSLPLMRCLGSDGLLAKVEVAKRDSRYSIWGDT